MGIGIQIALTLIGSLLGAILSLVLPRIIRTRRYNARKDLLGNWYSMYQCYQQPVPFDKWINEKVEIDIYKSRFRMRNSNNDLGDLYEAHGSLRNTELVGSWESTRRGAHASGSFMLTIIPMGGILYGYFTGPRDTGEKVYAAWVLSKKKDDLQKGKRLLQVCGIVDRGVAE